MNSIQPWLLVALCCTSLPDVTKAQHRIDMSAERARLADPAATEGIAVGCQRGASNYRPPPLPLALTVVSLAPADMSPVDKVSFEVVLKNVGNQRLYIPWSVTRSKSIAQCRLEHRLHIRLTIASPDSKSSPLYLGGTSLHGFPFDQSLLPLDPGETANIRGDVWIRVDESIRPIDPSEIDMSLRIHLVQEEWATEEVVSPTQPIRLRVNRPAFQEPHS